MPALAGCAAAIILPGALLGFMAHKQVDLGGWPHFVGVGCTAVVATVAAIALTACRPASCTSTRASSPSATSTTPEALLCEETGTAFDGRCVQALERVLARERADAYAVAV